MSFLGQSGGLVIPYGTLLPSGQAEFQFNDFKDPRYALQASNAQSYFGAVGLFRYLEVSGGLVNYAKTGTNPIPGQESTVFRHLLGNVKVGVPRMFEYQPDIAFGATDFGGQTRFFRSTYAVASQTWGPAVFTLGAGWGGQRLKGVFGGAEVSLWRTGFSVLAEDDAKVAYAGVRYRSPAIASLWGARIVGTVQRALNAREGGVAVDRTAIALSVQIPLGRRYDDQGAAASAVRADQPVSDAPLAPEAAPSLAEPLSSLTVPPRATLAVAPDAAEPAWAAPGMATDATAQRAMPNQDRNPDLPDTERLLAIRSKLIQLGLERVRVGRYQGYLVVEYENHRYNQNEADALGIVLGVAATLAPREVVRVAAVIEKAGVALGQVSVDRVSFADFIAGRHSDRDIGDTLLMSTRPTFDASQVAWISDKPGPRGFARIEIEPKTSYLIGTEFGKFDY